MSRLRTLEFPAQAKSFPCRSYKKCRVYVPQFQNGNDLNREQTYLEVLKWSAELSRTGAQRRSAGQRARAHSESGAEWRRHVAQHVTAAGTPAVIADRAGGVGAQPVAAQVATGIDALNREAGQILHNFLSPSGAARR
jgi:hypothetical protein